MDLFKEIIATYPELTSVDFQPYSGSIFLKDDGDGIQYLSSWDYTKPIPSGLKLGK